jgi:23S rRNA G2069 N7-methylase RlmK/C1962 C5-methylase RlmI
MTAEALGNRLRKNVRHLRKWAKREGVTCWRVYDRDMPEVPVTVDLYEGRAVVNDFGCDWDATDAVAAALELDPEAVFAKRRARMTHQAGTADEVRQYERLAERGARFEVGEGGHRFLVNLSDYTDTGLFLDHRITRARVAAEAAGKRVLNLFCYTAAFTVYVARAGAASSLSVDLSKTYLDWAGENLARNAIDPRAHALEHGDVRVVLGDLRARFDLAVVDPPSFSNSKRMTGTFDVQRDHAELLAAVARVMAPGGVIWFSTNLRSFQLDPPPWPFTDESRATIPPDFRDPKIHRAYRITI